MDRFLLMHSFARVVETGSFSAVARELGTGQPNVSRHIAALERHLGTRLLHRSTRKLTLTPEGERYYSETRRVIDAITEAESNARGEDAPQGLLRVACPTLLGRSHILPRVKEILTQFPGMEIDLQIGDRYIDLVEEGIDLAPTHPNDLLNHNCIVYTLSSAGSIWSFRDIDVAVHGRLRVNTPDGIR